VLRELRKAGQKVFFVGHELTDVTRSALSEGVADVILDRVPEAQARRTTDHHLSKIGLLTEVVGSPPVRFITLAAEKWPPRTSKRFRRKSSGGMLMDGRPWQTADALIGPDQEIACGGKLGSVSR
jgi:hypothetical protein